MLNACPLDTASRRGWRPHRAQPPSPRLRGEHDCGRRHRRRRPDGRRHGASVRHGGLEADRPRSRHAWARAGRATRAGLLLPDPGPLVPGRRRARTGSAPREAVFDGWRRGALDAAAQLRRLRCRAAAWSRATALLMARSGRGKGIARASTTRGEEAGVSVALADAAPGHRRARQLDVPRGHAARDGFVARPVSGLPRAGGGRSAPRRTHLRADAGEEGPRRAASTPRSSPPTPSCTRGTVDRRHRHRHRRVQAAAAPFQAPRDLLRADRAVARVPCASRSATVPSTAARPADAAHRIRWTPDDRLLVAGADQDETPARQRDAVLRAAHRTADVRAADDVSGDLGAAAGVRMEHCRTGRRPTA